MTIIEIKDELSETSSDRVYCLSESECGGDCDKVNADALKDFGFADLQNHACFLPNARNNSLWIDLDGERKNILNSILKEILFFSPC